MSIENENPVKSAAAKKQQQQQQPKSSGTIRTAPTPSNVAREKPRARKAPNRDAAIGEVELGLQEIEEGLKAARRLADAQELDCLIGLCLSRVDTLLHAIGER